MALAWATFDVADKGHDHIDQAVRRLAPGHDIGRQNEHGYRNQRRWPDATHHLLDECAHLPEAIEHHNEADDGSSG